MSRPVRGRVSASSLAVMAPDSVDRIVRPDPPDEFGLTQEQCNEWWAVIETRPADWYGRENFILLAQYCRLTIRAKYIANMIDQLEKSGQFDLEVYRKLLRSEQDIARMLTSLATKMRISQQALYDRTKRKDIQVKRPWMQQG